MKPEGYLASSPGCSSGPLSYLCRPCSKEVDTAVNMCDNIGHVFSFFFFFLVMYFQSNKGKINMGIARIQMEHGVATKRTDQEVLAAVKPHPAFTFASG